MYKLKNNNLPTKGPAVAVGSGKNRNKLDLKYVYVLLCVVVFVPHHMRIELRA